MTRKWITLTLGRALHGYRTASTGKDYPGHIQFSKDKYTYKGTFGKTVHIYRISSSINKHVEFSRGRCSCCLTAEGRQAADCQPASSSRPTHKPSNLVMQIILPRSLVTVCCSSILTWSRSLTSSRTDGLWDH